MTKARGKRIVIKFDKALLGDVTGNESAFTVTGMQKNPLFHGAPELTEYEVDSVSRLAIPVLYEEDFAGGTSDGVEVGGNGLVLGGGPSPALSFDGTDDRVTVGDVSALKITGALTLEFWVKGSGQNSKGIAGKFSAVAPGERGYAVTSIGEAGGQKISFLYQRAKSSYSAADRLNSATNVLDGNWHHIAAVFSPSNFARIYVDGELDAEDTTDIQAAIADNNAAFEIGRHNQRNDDCFAGLVDEVRVWNTARTQQQIQDNMNTELIGTETGLVAYYKLDEATGTTATDAAGSNNGTIYGATWTTRGAGFNELGTHTPPPIDATTLPTNPRIKYETDLPTGTSITVEYATNNSDTTPPETWTAVSDSDLLTIDGDFLWLKYTLETTDTAVTPTLLALWLEEAEAPPDKILLTFDESNRFNDVEGDITVAYNQSIGNLTGTRAVESFSRAFTPLDLEPTQHHQHTISVEGTGVLVDLLPVTYIDSLHDHTIGVAGTEVSVTLIHVDDIPP